ncbi:MAG: L-serine ammonia-lyase, iron-sulfur-dependent, subunit alpha [Bacteroidales bacterium]|jgi:L-serine dehydratase|nr:L-serine ammonia-lyase, iron-sulfur-dependent, subunit alpha [Bacteroidales bacterium]
MESIKEIFRIGDGPSSSHTMGPKKAAAIFAKRHPDAAKYRVTLYGSLAATGKGHLTDTAIKSSLEAIAPVEFVWLPDIVLPFHPNGMKYEALDTDNQVIKEWTVFSIGGGALANETLQPQDKPQIYDMNTLCDILRWCKKTGRMYWEYVQQKEESDIWDYLYEVWITMKSAVERGLETEGILPGDLGVRRKATEYYIKAMGYTDNLRTRGLVFAYALACAEENAAGGRIVTSPTCGSSGVLASVLYHLNKGHAFSEKRILKALATAGLIGNVVKKNASISGAEVGCQGEVGVACAMGAAAANQLFGGSPSQIEYAAEMGLEHHLGLTCDPVCGLVQIPCIERNAFAAARALDTNIYATFTDGRHRISFDKVVAAMKETGHNLPYLYKETSTGGLATQWEIEL